MSYGRALGIIRRPHLTGFSERLSRCAQGLRGPSEFAGSGTMSEVERAERQIAAALAEIDKAREPIDEQKVESVLSAAIAPKLAEGTTLSPAMIAELIGFRFSPLKSGSSSEWGTYFGPVFVTTDEAGTNYSSPDISQISAEVLAHWRRRINEVKHPLLRARYADLCWVFGKKCSGTKEPISTARIAIDSYIDIVEGDLFQHGTTGIRYVRRGLELARRIGEKARIKRAVDAMIALEKRIAKDSLMGLWGFSFEELSDDAVVDAQQLAEVVAAMESRLARCTDPILPDKEINPHAAERAALLLAAFYARRNQAADLKRVILACGDAFVRAGRSRPAMMASHWMQSVHELYEKHGFNEEAAMLEERWRELSEESLKELKPFSAQTSITIEEMNEYVDGIVTDQLEQSLDKIALEFLPRKASLEATVKDQAKRFPLSSLFSTSLLDESGRNVAKIGSVEDDLEGQVAHHFMMILQTHAIFLHACFAQIRDNGWFTTDRLVTALQRSPLFPKDRAFILQTAVEAVIANDAVVGIHLLIPQVEHAVRLVARDSRAKLVKQRRGGGVNLRTLDELLRDPKLEALLGPDIVFYLRAMLTDQRALNLRNDVCHGLAGQNVLVPPILERLLHVVLVLALLRKAGPEAEKPEAEKPEAEKPESAE
jgi:Domain of unknown function (DUF4209)